MNEPYDTVQERITTVEDGPDTVNERLSPGGPGPEGQPDTACERLSGQTDAVTADPTLDAPAQSALKGEWVDYAVTRGADRDEAEASTKQELIDEYGD